MVTKKDVHIINKSDVPAGRLIGQYTFLRDIGKTLSKDKAIEIVAKDAAEAKKIQNRWRAYFKGNTRSQREVQPDGKIKVYLSLKD